MTVVSLALAKAHMKFDGTAEDELISLYIEAAEQWAGNYIGKPIADLEPVPADVKLAILKLVSFHFLYRNLAVSGGSIDVAPHGVAAILDSYREEWFTDGN